jgi:hypothetical protein
MNKYYWRDIMSMIEGNHDNRFKVIATIADCHIGNKSISWKEYKYQLKNGVINKLKAMTYLDGIVICGDTLHYQISLNSEYASVFQWFCSQLIKIARNKGAFVTFIKGTRSHDLDQLETIRQYEDEFDVEFDIVNDYLIKEIDGHRYAFIAENYINESPKDYYNEIFDKPKGYFDMIFGHGTIEQTQFIEQNSENINTSAPIFKLKDFYKVCTGPIIFGHIHTPMVFNDKFYYVGSTLRTCHGEEEDKGFNIITYIKDSGKYRVDKIVNEFTFNFSILNMSNNFIENHDVDHICDYVDNYIDKNKIDRLSLKITCIDKEDSVVKTELLKRYFAKNKNISTSFKVLSQKAYERDETVNNNRITKSYLKDGLDITERIQLWALDKRNYRIDKDDILRFITADTLKRKGI